MEAKRLIFAVLFALFGLAQAADAPYPFREGTKWTLAKDGTEQVTLVEGIQKLKTPKGIVTLALVRRSDGTDRLVFRTGSEWQECAPQKTERGETTCENPFTFFVWPLETGKRWTSGGFDFYVAGKDALSTPYKNFPEAWRILYSTEGSSDPIGEIWMVENVGRVRLQEGLIDYSLTHFTPGEGEVLEASTPEAISAFIEKPGPSLQIPQKNRVLVFLTSLRSYKLLPLILFQAAVVVLVFVFGFGVLRSVRTGPGLSAKEEAKIVSLFSKSGNVEEAEKRFTQMVKEHPNYPDLRHYLASAQKALGKLEEARKNWEEAVKINGKYVDARLSLAQLLLELGDIDGAIKNFRAVVELKPTFADAQLGLGKSLFQAGDFRAAEESLSQALKINPSLTEAQQLLVECRNLAKERSRS